MNIKDAYEKYSTPTLLVTHMLRVGALTQIILDSWKGEKLNKKATIIAALLHDIAKPIVFDLAKQADYGMSPKQIETLGLFQEETVRKFGQNEHDALLGIVKELKCDPSVIKIVASAEWEHIQKILREGNIESLLVIYSDMRIGLNGILSINDRLEDLKKRSPSENYEEHDRNAKNLEKIIEGNTDLNLASITDLQLESLFESLLQTDLLA